MVRTSAQQRQELWPLTHQMIALFISSKLVDLEQSASPCAKICQQMFTCKRGIIQSKSVLANNLGIDVRSLGPSLRVLATAVLYQDRRVCALLVSRLGAYLSDGQRVDFVYFGRQDETPMRITRHAWFPVEASSQRNDLAALTTSMPFVCELDSALGRAARARPTMSKLIQSESMYGVRLIGSGGELISIIGYCATPLRLVDRTTGKC